MTSFSCTNRLASLKKWALFDPVNPLLPPRVAATVFAALTTLAAGNFALGASGTWANNTADPDANWSASTNWNAGNIPGSTDLTVSNTDFATFSSSSSIEQPVLDTDRRLGRVVIDNSQASYNLTTTSTANTLLLQQSGTSLPQLRIIGSGTTTIDTHVRIGSGATSVNPATWSTDSTNLTLSNGLSLAASGVTHLRLANTAPITIAGPVYANTGAGTLTFIGPGSANITGSIQNTASGTFTLNSQENFSGTLRLSGSNSFTTDVIWRSGVLAISSDNAFGASGTAAIQLGSTTGGALASSLITTGTHTVSRHLRISSGAINPSITVGGSHTSGTSVFSGSFSLVNRVGGVNLTAAAGGVVEFSGPLTGSAATQAIVTKVGAGVVKFTNSNNTYVGGTIVSAGTLLINNSSGSGTGTGAVVVNGGAFGGTGAVSGTVTINAGGTLTPGDSTAAPGAQAGTLATGSLNFTGGSLAMNISGSLPGDGSGFYDQVLVTGNVTLDSDVNFTLSLDGYNPPDDGTALFTLIDNNGVDPIAGSGLFNLNGSNLLAQGEIFSVGGQDFQISYTSGGTPGTFLGGGNDIAILAVPEPSSSLLLAGGLGLALAARRRRKP